MAKVLFVYPNKNGFAGIPMGIASLSSSLKERGHKTFLFDTTFIAEAKKTSMKKREEVGSFLPSDIDKYVKKMDGNPEEIFAKMAQEIQPDVIALSSVTYNFAEGLEYLNLLKKIRLKQRPLIIAGGKHATVVPDDALACDCIDIICIGEGEAALAELCDKLEHKEDYLYIHNLWPKKNGEVIKNPLRPFTDLNKLPAPDFDLFDQSHFYQPFVGKVYKRCVIEFGRGCTFKCTYCINRKTQELFKDLGRYVRHKSVDKIINELKYYKEKFGCNLVRFLDETFLLAKNSDLYDFLTRYKREINLPFIISTRPETVTDEKIARLKDAGCISISMGVESGNDIIRKKLLRREIAKETIINAYRIVNKYKIRNSSFNMMGLPLDSRRTFFETVELNRRARPTTQTINIFTPYEGTLLRKICLDMGILEKDQKVVDWQDESLLKLPHFPNCRIKGLRKTFVLYCKLPKIFFPLIYIAEKEGGIPDFIHRLLVNLMQKLKL